MSSLLHVKARQLEEHCALMQQECRAARMLCERLYAARRSALPGDLERLDRLIRRAERIERYFGEMSQLVERMYFEFGLLSRSIGELLEDNLYWYDRLSN